MVSTSEVLIDDIPISPMTSTPAKKPRARKSLCLFTKVFEMKNETANCRVGAAKYKRKAIKYGNTPWPLKKIEKGNQKSVKR